MRERVQNLSFFFPFFFLIKENELSSHNFCGLLYLGSLSLGAKKKERYILSGNNCNPLDNVLN